MEEIRQKMTQILSLLADDLTRLKAGRATPALVEKVMVEAYNTKMPLMELATIGVPEPSQLLITPFDQAVAKNIEKALAVDRGLGLQPVLDGQVIRLNIPPLTEEKRKELVKVLSQKMEAARVMIRQTRSEKMAALKKAFEEKEIHEDERRKQEQEVQKITDEMTGQIEQMGERKERELLSI